jgi:hypothetical protein
MPYANPLSPNPLDPTQKLAALEARLEKLESVLSVDANGDPTLKSRNGAVIIEASTNLMVRAGVMVKVESGATMSLKASSTFDMNASATMSFTASMINLTTGHIAMRRCTPPAQCHRQYHIRRSPSHSSRAAPT